MDRRWMLARRDSLEYAQGMETFISFALEHAEDASSILCPCIDCDNTIRYDVEGVHAHLIMKGINQGYKCWIKHGESINDIPHQLGSRKNKETHFEENYDDTYVDENIDDMDFEGNFDADCLDGMVEIIGENLQDCPKMFQALCNDANTPLYPGCTKYSRLSALLKLYTIKAHGGITDASLTSLLEAFKDMIPYNNVILPRIYEAKKVLSSIGMSCERIHVCPKDCILYRKEYASLDSCPICKSSRYEKEKVLAKVMWYFPIIPRFRRLFSIAEDANNLTWHADREKQRDDKLRHPTDSPQWMKIDNKFSDFGHEARNLCLALATDGMNPFCNTPLF